MCKNNNMAHHRFICIKLQCILLKYSVWNILNSGTVEIEYRMVELYKTTYKRKIYRIPGRKRHCFVVGTRGSFRGRARANGGIDETSVSLCFKDI